MIAMKEIELGTDKLASGYFIHMQEGSTAELMDSTYKMLMKSGLH